MNKLIARKSAVALALLMLFTPLSRAFADPVVTGTDPEPQVVTGTDPEPQIAFAVALMLVHLA